MKPHFKGKANPLLSTYTLGCMQYSVWCLWENAP